VGVFPGGAAWLTRACPWLLARGWPDPGSHRITGEHVNDIPRKAYYLRVVGRYVVELEPVVRDWLETLTLVEHAKVEAMADRAKRASYVFILTARQSGSVTGSPQARGLCC
jgi:hypothetical protein